MNKAPLAAAILLVAVSATAQIVPQTVSLLQRANTDSLSAAPVNPPRTMTVPEETEVTIELLSGIHSRVSHVQDPVRARLLRPVVVNGQVALPSGTLLDGHITKVEAARRMRRPAELALQFEQLTLPDGQAQRIRAVLSALEVPQAFKTSLDPEGHLRGSRMFPWKKFAAGLIPLAGVAGVAGAFGGTAALAPIFPASAGVLITYAMVWPRGNEVHLPPQARCRLRLNSPVTVRVQW